MTLVSYVSASCLHETNLIRDGVLLQGSYYKVKVAQLQSVLRKLYVVLSE